MFFLQEEHSAELRNRREAERMSAINQKFLEEKQDIQRKEDERVKQKEQEVLQLQQRREEERLARENMTMTVNLYSQYDLANFDADVDPQD